MTRGLTRDQAAVVDAAVAAAADESPGRLLAIAEAKTIEADLEGYRARLAEEAKRTGVWVSRPKTGDPTPYDPGGPPGQTGDHNDAPLIRFHHRAKTHDRYTVDQLGLGAYRWVTRHGLARAVTPRGTKKVELLRARDGAVAGEIYRDARIDIDYRPRP
ncbi:hypothetical protein SFC88_20620 [Nocardioides sp. HM23]|uniref:hypothetical protein n=1 Tax=Nocardioides bizhenqiangii TaxID=3095076 RepID=UPI002ACA1DB5|nr:hypothetical protein [Nocardioides sp. HM23]MDZ5623254.1 hypothetical protein [Nocardioides sp. HM23]